MRRTSDELVHEALATGAAVFYNRRTGLAHVAIEAPGKALCGSNLPLSLPAMPRSRLTHALFDATIPWCYHCVGELLRRKEDS